MIVRPPYVVVVSAPSSGVGKSTLASNLAVYLKGLEEDLPVSYVAADSSADGAARFALQGSTSGCLSDLSQDAALSDLLAFGEFGVEYCSVGSPAVPGESAAWLRKKLARADYDGILILDLANDHPQLSAAIWAADLVLLPIKDPAALGTVVAMRKELLAGGGSAEQLWLLPSELGAESRYSRSVDLVEFLRFAADERGFQVLEETLFADAQVREQATGAGTSVLTRAPQSPLHQQLRQLAELVLQQRQQQNSFASRVKRWLTDGVLPVRARRVDLLCPVCRQGGLSTEVHYLESYPSRQRLLLHRSCIEELLKGTGAAAFIASAGALLVRPGVAHGGRPDELYLQALSPDLELYSSDLFSPLQGSAWEQLLQRATGRCLAELYSEVLLLSPSLLFAEALNPQWYKSFVALRGRLRQACREEEI